MKLALWPRSNLARDVGVPVGPLSATNFSLGHNVNSRDAVDAVMREAEQAGATITKKAQETFWGGYSGYFQDPDGHLGRWCGIPIWRIFEIHPLQSAGTCYC
jgi:uncharacterized glyoxalase superfamily protein PhnB